jgi:hypothetical protein
VEKYFAKNVDGVLGGLNGCPVERKSESRIPKPDPFLRSSVLNQTDRPSRATAEGGKKASSFTEASSFAKAMEDGMEDREGRNPEC